MRYLLIALVFGFAVMTACTNTTTTNATPTPTPVPSVSEDSSASGFASAAVGGTLNLFANGSSPTLGYMTPQKMPIFLRLFGEPSATAGNACPTFMTASGSGCTNTSSTVVTTTYANCTFGTTAATWSGSDAFNYQGTVGTTGTAATLTCGTYPAVNVVDASAIFAHSYTGTRTASSGTVITVATDVTNYTGTDVSNQWESVRFSHGTLNTAIISGVRFTSGTPAIDYTMGLYNSTGLTVGTTASGATVSGNMNVYDNNQKVTGITTFFTVGYTSSCCQPTSGTISTAFAAGTNGSTGSAYNGQTEALVFSGSCGVATYVGVDGTTKTVNLVQCL
jgi:hypothetical protein